MLVAVRYSMFIANIDVKRIRDVLVFQPFLLGVVDGLNKSLSAT